MGQTIDSFDSGVLDTVREAVDGVAAGRVFGTPVVQDGVVLLPVASISGGGGGGGGTATENGDPRNGAGGGFGTNARGLGVFVLKDGAVSWHPAVDVNRIVLGGQLVAVAALLLVRSLVRRRAKRASRR